MGMGERKRGKARTYRLVNIGEDREILREEKERGRERQRQRGTERKLRSKMRREITISVVISENTERKARKRCYKEEKRGKMN